MRIDELTNLRLFYIYEGGGSTALADIFHNLEINRDYTRTRAREVITDFINKYATQRDELSQLSFIDPRTRHPLINLSPMQTRMLLETLQQDSKGLKQKEANDGPSVY